MKPHSIHSNHSFGYKVYAHITLAVLISIVLIVRGIWNAEQTGQIAEENIQASLQLQQLSNLLSLHEEAMSTAVESAITSGNANWLNNYENSLSLLQDILLSSAVSVEDQIIDTIQEKYSIIVAQERQLFKLIAQGKSNAAFSLLASDTYQESKIEQEQHALTLRATLERKSKEIIQTLNERLRQTTLTMILQIGLIIAIWCYIIAVVRKWQLTQSKHSQELSRLAHYDPLTGTGNRTLFQHKLDAAFQQSKRDKKPVGLLVTDIDHFKEINDNLGHDIGDALLIYVANQIVSVCRETDTVVRLGGDEFAIIASNLDNKRNTALLANKILNIFEKPLSIKGHEIKTGTSLGLAFYPDDADSADELMRKADMALYEAKRHGRGNFKFFDAAIEKGARRKLELQKDLLKALNNNEFELYYQPIIDLKKDSITGAECLLRWHHPERGFIPPDDFINIAEDSRLIVPIGEWVLKKACQQQVYWQQQGHRPINISVNLSGVQFDEDNLVSVVEGIMQETGIRKDRLILEITESTLMENVGEVITKLHALNALGLKLSIDDFGTGYSSLAYLKRFPIHHLKIDREFIKDLPNDSHDIAIARSIIKMAHELSIGVVAEGIEKQTQLNFLNKADCNFGQGYYFGKPMPANEFEEWLRMACEPSYANVHPIKP